MFFGLSSQQYSSIVGGEAITQAVMLLQSARATSYLQIDQASHRLDWLESGFVKSWTAEHPEWNLL
jgi:hypothetical protein